MDGDINMYLKNNTENVSSNCWSPVLASMLLVLMSLNCELLNLIIQYNMEGEGEMVEIVCLKLGIMQGFWLIKLSQ